MSMKIQLQLAAALTVLAITLNAVPVYAVSADRLPEAAVPAQHNDFPYANDLPKGRETVSSGDPFLSSGGTQDLGHSAAGADGSDTAVPHEAPMFSARVEFFDGQGYLARGTFTEFLPDTSLVQPLYSLDGKAWQPCRTTWNLQWLGKDTPEDQKSLQTQTCLYGAHEPLAGYLAGRLDRFYLKLQITLKNGMTYESQAAVIDRGDPQPVPEEYRLAADFTSAMRIRQWRPFRSYGQYQITVSADATPEEISALLPDTLPIRVDLYEGIHLTTDAVVDCPVTWKPLSLSRLTPGESITIEDAAEEITVPAGSRLNTPTGIFELDEPLGFDHDEIKLILNVVERDAAPAGTLHGYFAGLEISFDLKPTGATAIRAYTFSEGDSSWTEVTEPLLPETVNSPSSLAGSLFTFVLTAEQEPYHSWLAANNAGDEPRPFLVGLKLEGGVYDGQQLILTYPDTYEIPLQPPTINGSGGNEGNAGSDNKNDSTPEGQRPNLPQDTEDKPDTESTPGIQNPVPSAPPKDNAHSPEPELTQEPDKEPDSPEPDTEQISQEPKSAQGSNKEPDSLAPKPAQGSDKAPDSQEPKPAQGSDKKSASQKSKPAQIPENGQNTRETGNSKDIQETENGQNAQETELAQIISAKPKDSPANLIRPLKEPAGTMEGIPLIDGDTHSPAWWEKDSLTGRAPQWLYTAAAAAGICSATAAIGICIAAVAGKATTGSAAARISGKIIRAFHRFFS